MIDRATKLRFRRRVRRRRRQVEDMGFMAEDHIDKHFIRRMNRLIGVRRFVASWLLLLVLLMGGVVVQTRALGNYYLKSHPVAGGTYTEGLLGSFTNANPLYASSLVDASVAELVFAGLFKYDDQNKLAPDLAESWQVDEAGTTYTVKLKHNLHWHDGVALTAEDVVFTYQTIQNPDAKSPLRISWQGIGVKALDAHTITFELPNTLSAFPYSMTNGIVPRHKLHATPMSQLRSATFNTVDPVGSGPFTWDILEVKGSTPEEREERIALKPFDQYHAGEPKISQFVVRAFREEDRLVKAMADREITAIAGLEVLPESLRDQQEFHEKSMTLTGSVMVFFKTHETLLSDAKIRQALVKAADVPAILEQLPFPVQASRSPLLPSHIGYNRGITQFEHAIDEANTLLDQAGWIRGDDGLRRKEDKMLQINLVAQSTPEYITITSALQDQWRQIGVDTQVTHRSSVDFQDTLTSHAYDALLHGISLGSDPDVFPFWHSSQASGSTRLNFSEYRSGQADAALEAGRTRGEESLRALKYKPFLEAWRNDAPALALYQPRFLYITRGEVTNLVVKIVNSSVDRFTNVHNWMIREAKTVR